MGFHLRDIPSAHQQLAAKGITPRMEVQPGYATVLRLASAGRTRAKTDGFIG